VCSAFGAAGISILLFTEKLDADWLFPQEKAIRHQLPMAQVNRKSLTP
jgi:hypothetical protein